MKAATVVSVSIGSSSRDHEAEQELAGRPFHIRRVGTDGDLRKARALLEELDGSVDAIGLGGLDVYLYSRSKRYALRDGLRLMQVVKQTPVVDGSGLKNTLERETIRHLAADGTLHLKDAPVLMVCGMDRFGMAQTLEEAGARVTYGDLIFGLKVDEPIRSLDELEERADMLLPEVCKMPISLLYPTGSGQVIDPDPTTRPYLEQARVIAGDFHYIWKNLPERLDGKTIVTNTVTAANVEELSRRGLDLLITTTPEWQGRSFGTNVVEAALLVLLGKSWDETTAEDYLHLLQTLDLRPRVLRL